MKNPVITGILALTILFSTATGVNAAKAPHGDSMGDLPQTTPSVEKQLQDILKDPDASEGMRQQAKKQLELESMTEEQREKERKGTFGYLPKVELSVPNYKQENSYYCGPATTKQTMQYLTGKSDSQKTIAKALGTTTNGTDGTRIVKYLNEKQKRVKYSIYSKPTANYIKTLQALHFSHLASITKPHVARVKFKKDSSSVQNGWQYSTNGHFFNTTGYTAEQKYTRITDPNIKRINSKASGHYHVSYSKLEKALKDHFLGHYYA